MSMTYDRRLLAFAILALIVLLIWTMVGAPS